MGFFLFKSINLLRTLTIAFWFDSRYIVYDTAQVNIRYMMKVNFNFAGRRYWTLFLFHYFFSRLTKQSYLYEFLFFGTDLEF